MPMGKLSQHIRVRLKCFFNNKRKLYPVKKRTQENNIAGPMAIYLNSLAKRDGTKTVVS